MERLTMKTLKEYNVVWEDRVEQDYVQAVSSLNRKIIVLDDDPTGVQTVHGLHVYTGWDEKTIEEAFEEKNEMVYILTNSRSFTPLETQKVHETIATRIEKISVKKNKAYLLISRSDSTLRGHYPLETETLRKTIQQQSGKVFDGEIIIPFFLEGGRYTVENIHYVQEGETLKPVAETEFALDKSFGYVNSHLGRYIEEKTGGDFLEKDCLYIGLQDLCAGNIEKIAAQLMKVSNFNKIIVNATTYMHVEVFVIAFIRAMKAGKEFMIRSAASFPRVIGAIGEKPLLSREDIIKNKELNGGITMIGSHVVKTSLQLEELKTSFIPLKFIEFNQHLVTDEKKLYQEVVRVTAITEKSIREGESIVIYTRRERFDPDTANKDSQLQIAVKISDSLTSIIARLRVRPAYIIAKGGITSSDVGTKALQVKKALVMGQIRPGIPVWLTDPESKFPQLPFIIFPGNVGEKETLKEIIDLLS